MYGNEAHQASRQQQQQQQQQHQVHHHHRLHSLQEGTPVSPLLPTFPLSQPALLRHSNARYDAYDLNHPLVSPLMSRSASVASDRHSTVSALSVQYPINPANVSPAPAYVAAFAAAQVLADHPVTSIRQSSDEEDDVSPSSRRGDATFADASLTLANAFLDQMLFSVLSVAKSTSLTALRPAVREVLRSRLANEAIASAEEELHELLAGGEEEDQMNARQSSAEQNRQWDLELVWKRTRLRVMVYIRLGEMEDEDEERYVKEDDLFQGNERRFSQSTGLVSWAAAIFLTSILEYVAEQVLQSAGRAAYSRVRRQSRVGRLADSATGMVSPAPGVTIEDYDMEKVALDPLLGRIWRTWRKTSRNNINSTASSPSKQFRNNRFAASEMNSPIENSRNSFTTALESAMDDSRRPSLAQDGEYSSPDKADDIPEARYPEHILAANIPLPLANHKKDVEEIEVPGVARDPDEEEEDGARTPSGPHLSRRNSLTGSAPFRNSRGSYHAKGPSPQDSVITRPDLERRRSRSVPAKARILGRALTVNILNDEDEKDELAKPEPETSADVKPLLDKIVDGADQDEEEGHSNASQDTGNQTIVGSAIAGATAIAAAAASVLTGSKAERRKSGPPIWIDTKNAEELDKQKQLLNVKESQPAHAIELTEPTEPQSTHTQPQPSQEPRPSPDTSTAESASTILPQTISAQAPDSKTPDELVEGNSPKEPQQVADAADESAGTIGVAKTLDTFVSTPTTEEEDSSQVRNAVSSRASAAHLPKLAMSNLAGERGPTAREQDGVTPSSVNASRERLVQNTTPTSATDKLNARSQGPSRRSSNRESPITSTSQAPEKSQWRKSLSSALERSPLVRNRSKSRSRSASESEPVQEHPIVQRMSSLRTNGKTESEAQPLTSASIRSPQDFDTLVQGGDTVKYTLTPGTVRNEGLKGEAETTEAAADSASAKTLERPSTSHKTAPSAIETRAGRSHSIKQATAANGSATDEVNPQLSSAEREARAEKRRSISRPPVRNTSSHRKSGLTAREPQVMTESTRDIADFIRSTGPVAEQEVVPIFKNRSTTSLQSLRDAHIHGSRASSPGARSTRSLHRNTIGSADVPPVPPMPTSRGRQGMQPRGATSVTDSSGDLIDFIRSGPVTSNSHRISRTVAPFRSTMDSDQLADWGERLVSQPDIKLDTARSTKSASSVFPSSRNSVNSRAPLIRSSSATDETVHPAHSGVAQSLSAPMTHPGIFTDGGRKKYRNKDPYAIDLDDEDDDLLTALPKNVREEESLVDFLKNNEPPSNNAPRSVLNGSTTASSKTTARVPSQISNSSSARRNSLRSHGADIVSLGRRPSATSRPNLGSSHSNSSFGTASISGKPPAAKMEARSPSSARQKSSSGKSDTRDLADFLRSSGPGGDEDELSAPAPTVGRKSRPAKTGGAAGGKENAQNNKVRGFFSGFAFWNRKKVEGGKKTYLDL